jgi:hypothetical protein
VQQLLDAVDATVVASWRSGTIRPMQPVDLFLQPAGEEILHEHRPDEGEVSSQQAPEFRLQ